MLEHDLLRLIECNLVVPPIVELGSARALTINRLLRMLKQPAVLQKDRDPGRAERVVPELSLDAGSTRNAKSFAAHRFA